MSNPRWFEEKPSATLQKRIEQRADQELQRQAEESKASRRGLGESLLSMLRLDYLAAAPVAALAAFAGFWLTIDRDERQVRVANYMQKHGIDALETESLGDAEEFEVASELEFADDLEWLEEVKDEELQS